MNRLPRTARRAGSPADCTAMSATKDYSKDKADHQAPQNHSVVNYKFNKSKSSECKIFN